MPLDNCSKTNKKTSVLPEQLKGNSVTKSACYTDSAGQPVSFFLPRTVKGSVHSNGSMRIKLHVRTLPLQRGLLNTELGDKGISTFKFALLF